MTLVAESIADQFDRLPPHSIDAEMALLASMALDKSCFPEVRLLVQRDSFFQVDHQIIFDVLLTLWDGDKAIDPLLVREELIRRQLLDEVGGSGYLARLLNSVPSSAHAVYYAEIIREKFQRRQMISLANEMIRRAGGPSQTIDPIGELIESSSSALAKLSAGGRVAGDVEILGDVLAAVRSDMTDGDAPLITTGFRGLDDSIGGFGLGETWLLGGRPSMGKSTLAKQIALRVARRGIPCLIISLEESKAKMGRNIIAAESRIENNRIRRVSGLGVSEWQQIDSSIQSLDGIPLHMTDRARSLSEIRSVCAMAVARWGIKLLVIDYLQRISAPGKDRYEKVSNASLGISDMIKDLMVVGVIPVQLSRAVESRDDKRPHMADLRDSGQIEQDGDGVLLLHREDYYRNAEAGYIPTREAELIVAKCRDGVRGKPAKLRSELQFQTFADLQPDLPPEFQ